MMDEKVSERRTEIDVAKGFALFLVILGHVLEYDKTLSRWIFMFHMPAFFFLSGMTFRPEKYKGCRHFLREKCKKWIVPYLVITLIGFLICMIRADYRQPILDSGWRYMLSWIFFYGQPQNLYVGQIWFLIALFMAEAIAWFWFRFWGRRSVNEKCFSLLVLAWMAMNVSRLNGALLPFERLPWKIDTGLCGAVFLIAGYYTAKEHLVEKLKDAAYFLIPFCTWLSYYYGPKWYGEVNMCDCIYSPGPYYFLVAFLSITALLLTAFLCKNWRFWQYCGRYSLPMFAAQTFVIYWIVELIELGTGKVYMPMFEMYGIENSLLFSAAVFMLLAVLVYPWHFYKKKAVGKSLFLRKYTKK